jgi:hypothetical protein
MMEVFGQVQADPRPTEIAVRCYERGLADKALFLRTETLPASSYD